MSGRLALRPRRAARPTCGLLVAAQRPARTARTGDLLRRTFLQRTTVATTALAAAHTPTM